MENNRAGGRDCLAKQDYSLGVVGSGARAQVICRNLRDLGTFPFSVDAVYDADAEAAQRFIRAFGHGGTAVCGSYLEVIEGRPDAVIITSVNSAHLGPAAACFEAGIPVYMEKPLAATWEDTRELVRRWRSRRTPAVVGFVLRYTTFYRKVKELCSSGALGDIVQIYADENFGPRLVSLFLRGWRRFREHAGPILSEKCCHDLDMLNWITASRPVRVASLGARTVFTPRDDVPDRCRGCPAYETCLYRCEYPDPEGARRDDGIREYSDDLQDLCVWNCEKDVLDHQTAVIEYESGTVATLSLNMSAEATRRTIRVWGTRGRIEGDLEDGRVVEYPVDGSAPKEHAVAPANESGHHGGDRAIAAELEKAVTDPEGFAPLASVEEGYASALVAFAADRSLRERRTVECAELEE